MVDIETCAVVNTHWKQLQNPVSSAYSSQEMAVGAFVIEMS